MRVCLPSIISLHAGFPKVSLSPVASMRSSINWKHNPTFSPHSAIVDTTSGEAPDNRAPVRAQVVNIAAVLPLIMWTYSSSVTNSRSSKDISCCWPSLTLRTMLPMILTNSRKYLSSKWLDSASTSKATANIASPALIAVGWLNSTWTAGRPRRTESLSMISSWTSVKLWIISIEAPKSYSPSFDSPTASATNHGNIARIRLPPPAIKCIIADRSMSFSDLLKAEMMRDSTASLWDFRAVKTPNFDSSGDCRFELILTSPMSRIKLSAWAGRPSRLPHHSGSIFSAIKRNQGAITPRCCSESPNQSCNSDWVTQTISAISFGLGLTFNALFVLANNMWSSSCSTHISSALALYNIRVIKCISSRGTSPLEIPNSCSIFLIAAIFEPSPNPAASFNSPSIYNGWLQTVLAQTLGNVILWLARFCNNRRSFSSNNSIEKARCNTPSPLWESTLLIGPSGLSISSTSITCSVIIVTWSESYPSWSSISVSSIGMSTLHRNGGDKWRKR